ncbi:Calx-beta domain-containing protein [Lysobacter antibioticus]|uniref:Calx-beta domain-containing protein n=1 Tax=Lysobacter antibioticus TaxID=84531 RepID=UPI000B4550FC|nr:Calx-beta domain-containing protein [Lysobacter antibioticus]
MDKCFSRLSAALLLALASAGSAHAQVVISQVYGGGGNSGATLKSDFIELHNNGSDPVDLTGWSVQYASSTGSNWSRTPLTGTIAPGGYYLIKQADGSGGTVALPTPDAIGTLAMAGGAGKVALVNHNNALSGACPLGSIDFVGYGSGTNCAEGSQPTATLSAILAALRADNGCTDTDVNGADFATAPAAPRNRASAAFSCGGANLPVLSIGDVLRLENAGEFVFTVTLSEPAPAGGVSVRYATADGSASAAGDYNVANGTVTFAEGQTSATVAVQVNDDSDTEGDETFFVRLSSPTGARLGDGEAIGTIVNDEVELTAIHAIQGSGQTSPLVGQRVYTSGIVTGRKSNGFFLQAPDDQIDADPATSEAVFVFTGSPVPAAAAVGNTVRASGQVIEYIPTADPGQLPLTELGNGVQVVFVSQPAVMGPNTLPQAVALSTSLPSPDGGLDQLERFEGMRVVIPSATVVSPTQGSKNETNATGSGNGIFNVVVTGVPRPFREPGIQAPDAAPGGGSIPPIPRWDFNPELITVDSDALGGTAFNLSTGAVVTDLTGPLDYGFRRYTILRDPAALSTITQGMQPVASRLPLPWEFTIASYNVERFFDAVNDPAIGEPVLTPEAYARRLGKVSQGISYLQQPDILGLIEVENLTALQDIAARVNADAVAAGRPDPKYVAYLQEGNDIGGIDVGYLIKTADFGGQARVEVQAVTQVGKDATWTQPDGSSGQLNDRPPLMLQATVHGADGRSFPVTVILVHQRSLIDSELDDAAGHRVRMKRQAQAEFLARFIQERQLANPAERIVTLGDFNAFEFNDGLTDVINTVAGTPTPDDQTAVPGDGADLVEPNLVKLGDLETPDQRYSYTFGGSAQTIDHVLANQALVGAAAGLKLDHARINADFPEINRSLADSPSRLSDHDPVVAYIDARRRADLAVIASTSTASVRVGRPVQFSATLNNAGPEQADYPGIGFAINAELPALSVVAPAGWNCDTPQVNAGSTHVACNRDALANGEGATFALSANATEAMIGKTTTLAVAAQAQSFDPNDGNDQALVNVETTARADLAIDVDGPRVLRGGQNGAFSVALRNRGGDVAVLPSVTLYGDAPAGNVSIAAPAGWNCTVAPQRSGFEATCEGARLAAGASQRFDFAIVAPRPGLFDRRLLLTGLAASAVEDPNPFNDFDFHLVQLTGRWW